MESQMSDEPLMVEIKVNYKGMYSALRINLSEYQNEKHYIEVIRDHIEIAKEVIDKQIRPIV
jgi:hypothetical protein